MDPNQSSRQRIGSEALTSERNGFDTIKLQHRTGSGQLQSIQSAVVMISRQQNVIPPESTGQAVVSQLSNHLGWVCPTLQFFPVIIETGQKGLCISIAIQGKVTPPALPVSDHPGQASAVVMKVMKRRKSHRLRIQCFDLADFRNCGIIGMSTQEFVVPEEAAVQMFCRPCTDGNSLPGSTLVLCNLSTGNSKQESLIGRCCLMRFRSRDGFCQLPPIPCPVSTCIRFSGAGRQLADAVCERADGQTPKQYEEPHGKHFQIHAGSGGNQPCLPASNQADGAKKELPHTTAGQHSGTGGTCTEHQLTIETVTASLRTSMDDCRENLEPGTKEIDNHE